MMTASVGDVAVKSLMSSALSSPSLGQQMLSLASSTLKLAASAIRFQQTCNTSSIGTKPGLLDSLPEYTLDEVSWHDRRDDCWIVLHDKIYNITSLLNGHPGGYDVLLEQAGRDCTLAFRSVNHSLDALEQVDEYLVGVLPKHQRIYLR